MQRMRHASDYVFCFIRPPSSRRSLRRNPGPLVRMGRKTFQSVRGLMTYADRSLLSFRTINTLIHFIGTDNFEMWLRRRYSTENALYDGYLKTVSINPSNNF